MLTADQIAKAIGVRRVTETGASPHSAITCQYQAEASPKKPTEQSSFPVVVVAGTTGQGVDEFPPPEQCSAVIAQVVGATTPPRTTPVNDIGTAACRSGVGSTREPLVAVAYKAVKSGAGYAVLVVYVGTFEAILKSLGARPTGASLTALLKEGMKRL